MIPITSQSLWISFFIQETYSFVLAPETVELESLISSKIAEIASAVLKSSSIAASYFTTSSIAFFWFSCSSAVIASPDTFASISRSFSIPVKILSRPFLEASIRSALKFNGLL